MNSDIIYAGTTSGIYKSGNGGLSWSDPSNGALGGVRVHSLAIDPATPSNLYAGAAGGLIGSTDGGAIWSNRLAAEAIYNIVFGSQHTVYAADYDDVSYYPGPSTTYKSTDDGATWIRSGASGRTFLPNTLIVDPKNPNTLYVIAGYGEGIYSSSDGGSTWSRRGLAGFYVQALAIDPQNPTILYAANFNAVLKSVDSGATWVSIAADAHIEPASALAVDPRNATTLYLATYDGRVYRSTNGGATWSQFDTGLNSPYIVTLSIDSTGKRLHAAGNGVFDYQIFSGALDLAVGVDNTSRLLFTDTDARLTLRSVDSAGNSASIARYEPFSGWYPRAAAGGADGLTRVLWNNLDGSVALWLAGPGGSSYQLGPVQGWTAVDVAAGPAGKTHVLWTHTDNRAALWTVDNSGHVSLGPTLGPYPGWSAAAIADGADGLTRLLWNKVDGSAGLSLVGPGGLLATYRYGGSVGWRAVDVAVGADGQSRILWTHADGRMALFRVDDSGNVSARGPVYAAPAGFAAQRVGAGPDGLTRVLWTDLNGSALLWQMSADNVYQRSFPVGSN